MKTALVAGKQYLVAGAVFLVCLAICSIADLLLAKLSTEA